MSLPKTVVNRPTTVAIIFIILIGLGLYSASDLAIDLYPEIDPPILVIFTDYPGAGPEEVEKSVTRPLEGVLSNVGNIESITSTSSEGSSQVMIEFTWGTEMAEASNDGESRSATISDARARPTASASRVSSDSGDGTWSRTVRRASSKESITPSYAQGRAIARKP